MSDLNKSSLRVEVPDAGEEPAVAQRTGSAGTPSTTRSMLTPLTLPLSAVSRLVPGTKKSVWQVPHRLRSSVDPRARAASQAIYQSQVAQVREEEEADLNGVGVASECPRRGCRPGLPCFCAGSAGEY